MISIPTEALTTVGGIVASAVAGIVGFFRFRAWWVDRVRQARIESATYLKEKGKEPWEVELGTEQLRRLHFEGLTGIDRTSGHEALLRCQQRLGGTDNDWLRMRNVGRFLVATGHTARVRKPGRKALVVFVVSGGVSFLCALLAIWIVAVVAEFVDKTPISAVRLPHAAMFVVATAWSAALGLVATYAFQFCLQIANARTLYKELVVMGRESRSSRKPQKALPAISATNAGRSTAAPPSLERVHCEAEQD